MNTVIIAEKPSVARSIAEAIGARNKAAGSLRGNGYIVTWALGHLVGIAEPHEMDATWKSWREEHLPMLPRVWPLKVIEATRSHFLHVESLLRAPDVGALVCATDAGREGELIFRYIYQKTGCAKPVHRLWISSLTPDAIRAGFRDLKPSASFDNLAAAAEARSRADWLVGMNFTRAYTLRFGGSDLLSVGRVQTPTLAMLVEREKAIRSFVPEPYCEVRATFGEGAEQYRGVWWRPPKAKPVDEASLTRLPADQVLAREILARCEGQRAKVVESNGTDQSFPPPLLYDLTELQRHANRLYGMTAQATLRSAQSLYETHKLLSYPRTDSRHLSGSVAATLPAVVDAVASLYPDMLAPGTGQRALSKRYVDDAKVTDHHALIPTSLSRATKHLTTDEARIYDLVSRRLLMAWHAEHKTRVTRVTTWVPAEARPGEAVDLFRSSGTVVTQVGWKILDIRVRQPHEAAGAAQASLPDGLAVGQVRPVTAIDIQEKQTSPPPPLTDALLLTAMESAGRTLDSRELEEAMRERGLGTPATRAAILETLIGRGYVERKGKALRATEKGIALVDVVHESVKSPQLTGEWELALKRLERGEGTFAALMARVERFVAEVVGVVRRAPAKALRADGPSAPATWQAPAPPPPPRMPAPRAPLSVSPQGEAAAEGKRAAAEEGSGGGGESSGGGGESSGRGEEGSGGARGGGRGEEGSGREGARCGRESGACLQDGRRGETDDGGRPAGCPARPIPS